MLLGNGLQAGLLQIESSGCVEGTDIIKDRDSTVALVMRLSDPLELKLKDLCLGTYVDVDATPGATDSMRGAEDKFALVVIWTAMVFTFPETGPCRRAHYVR
jgi:hypothetical protein